MENYNNIINNDYNAMVYGGEMQQQQHPMTSIPREMQIDQDQTSIHQVAGGGGQQSDIINLSYNQRDMQLPHPDLPQQMGLFPTVSIPPQQQHNHILQQQQQQSVSEQQQIPQNVNISYSMDNVNVNLDVQNNNNDDGGGFNNDDTPKDSAQLDAGENSHNNNDEQQQIADNVTINESEEQSNEKASEEEQKPKEPEVDPNQCRVCKATDSLIDIFAIEEDMRICDIITKLCSNIRIHERDFLPHMICLGCLGRLRIAFKFMKDVQATDKELRDKLKRSRKARKPNDGFVIIDCNVFSESDDDDLPNDDDEYQISNVEEDDDETSSGAESENTRRTKPPKKRGPKRVKTKKAKQELYSTAKRLKRDVVYIEANDSSDEKRKKEKCKDCGKIFSTKTNLYLHRKKAHSKPVDDTPFKCHVCGRGFKYSINLTSHMQIHKDSFTCDECGRVFATKTDVKKHALNQHKCSLSYECNKCRRLYCSVKRYQKHRESCSDYSSSSMKRKPVKAKEDSTSYTGRDLFKTVAPVTTTYWSDSFSD